MTIHLAERNENVLFVGRHKSNCTEITKDKTATLVDLLRRTDRSGQPPKYARIIRGKRKVRA
jgi:hypothetical protein